MNVTGISGEQSSASGRCSRHLGTVCLHQIRVPLIPTVHLQCSISYFHQLSLTGILLPSTSPRDGIFDSAKDPLAHQGFGDDPRRETLDLLGIAHATPTYREFLAHPALRGFVRGLMGWSKEILLERAILRHNCPGSLSTGIHYDKLFLRAGEAESLTAWVPIGAARQPVAV